MICHQRKLDSAMLCDSVSGGYSWEKLKIIVAWARWSVPYESTDRRYAARSLDDVTSELRHSSPRFSCCSTCHLCFLPWGPKCMLELQSSHPAFRQQEEWCVRQFFFRVVAAYPQWCTQSCAISHLRYLRGIPQNANFAFTQTHLILVLYLVQSRNFYE